MKRFLFAVAAVALIASVGSAEDKPATTPPATATPAVVGTPGKVISATTTTTHRRGLFSRLRNRGATVVVPAPVVPAPTPMPGTKTTPSTKTTPNGIIAAGGTDNGKVTTASYSEPAQRRGLLSRLLNR